MYVSNCMGFRVAEVVFIRLQFANSARCKFLICCHSFLSYTFFHKQRKAFPPLVGKTYAVLLSSMTVQIQAQNPLRLATEIFTRRHLSLTKATERNNIYHDELTSVNRQTALFADSS